MKLEVDQNLGGNKFFSHPEIEVKSFLTSPQVYVHGIPNDKIFINLTGRSIELCLSNV